VFFVQRSKGYDAAAITDLPVTTSAPCFLPQVHCLQWCQYGFTIELAHGMQDIHEDDEGIRQTLVNAGPAAIENIRELAVG
jgi:hypothetical protein